MAMEEELTLGHEHTIQYTDDGFRTVHLNLYNFANHYHPNKFNKKISKLLISNSF